MRGLDMVANAAVLTLLTAVCSIPLVTIGAALSASYEAAWAAKEGRGYLLRTYFSAFKRTSQLQRPYGQCSPQLD